MACTLGSGCQVRGLVGSNESESDTSGTGGASLDTSAGPSSTVTTSPTSATEVGPTSDASTTEAGTTESFVFDVLPGDLPEVCAPPQTRACDLDDDEWYHAMGFSCDGEVDVAFETMVEIGALLVHQGVIGTYGTFAPRQGEKLAILSTGRAHEVPMTPEALIAINPGCDPKICPSTGLGATHRLALPDPLQVRRVSKDGRDCFDDPQLVGEGDCSNSIEEHWVQGSGAWDYSELRVRATVPANTDAFEYDFAFFSSEYPYFIDHTAAAYNDMYIAWLESEAWTGNVSFDEEGNPITVHSVLLDYRTDSVQCPGCVAPQLAGFSMEEHAGTRWLTTRAPVEPGEDIELVFAIFDLSDNMFDSVVLLDGFHWSCADGPPVTWAG